MRILIVDDDPSKYKHLMSYSPTFTTSKPDTYKLLQGLTFDVVFVNTKFNEDFVNRIRSFDPYVPVFLVNFTNDGKGIVEYASLIDGYLINVDQVARTIERLISKFHYANVCV